MLSRGYCTYKSMNVIIDQKDGQGALWLGDYPAAINEKLQKQNNIKTILTVAQGLNIKQKPGSDILHKVYNIQDTSLCKINIIWGDTYQVIEEGLQRGSVLVHCRAGVSRSAATVIAYLMRKEKISFQTAIEFVKLKRDVVSPNLGFQMQLKQYEKQLTEKNEQQALKHELILDKNVSKELQQF